LAFRVYPIEIGENSGNRTSQTVDVEATEFGPILRGPMLVASPQPFDEVTHFGIAPHPTGEPRKGLFGGWCMRVVADVAVDTCGVGPIRLDRDDIEPVLFNQAARDRRSGLVEFRSAMARLPKKDNLRIRKTIEICAKFVDFVR
jgi:hypothetical protein